MTINTTKNMHEQLVSQNPSETVSKMTNREWLQSLGDEELLEYIDCQELPLRNYEKWLCQSNSDYLTNPAVCVRCKSMWLKAEHKEVRE